MSTSALAALILLLAAPALRAGTLTVTNAGDDGPGSLRQALADARAGDTIVFDPAVFNGEPGDVITVANYLSVWGQVTIDASGLPAGVTLSGGGTTQIFRISGGPTILALHGLTLTGGWDAFRGGAIFNLSGMLSLTRCTLSGNSAGDSGGAIQCRGFAFLTLTNCTLSGNSAGTSGGAIDATYGLTLRHCTLSGNTAANSGGGVSFASGTFTLENCIIAGNTAANDPASADIYKSGSFVRVGANIVQFLSDAGGTVSGPDLLTDAPLLAPLGDYGGPTHTLALRPGSPALNNATVSDVTIDQRGFPVVGVPDLGAYEAGNTLLGNCAAYLAESLPTGANLDPAFDYDGDGASNGDEWLALTNPRLPASVLRATLTLDAANLFISFPSVAGRNYTLWRSDTLALGSFADTGLPAIPGDGTVKTFTLPLAAPGIPARSYRVRVSP